jgi:succinyl-CoA synthetase alpha subunit
MILTKDDAVLVQGITGKQAGFWTERMLEAGTKVVAGTSPGKGGQVAVGLPVYDNAVDAVARHAIDVSVVFAPPPAVKGAVLDALGAGIRKVVVLTEHVPVHDVMEFLALARERGAQILGPNTAGAVTPGEASVGFMPAFAANIFRPGDVGIVSRSGSLGTLVAMNVVAAGYGQRTFIGIGGDPVNGTTTLDAVKMLDADARTRAVIIVGELGGAMEEDAAPYIRGMKKPVLAFIAGRSAPPGRRMGHAGAIVDGASGSGESKVDILRAAGVRVLDSPSEIGPALSSILK